MMFFFSFDVIVCMKYTLKQSLQTVPPTLTCRYIPNQFRSVLSFALDVTGVKGAVPVPPGKKFTWRERKTDVKQEHKLFGLDVSHCLEI